MSTTKRLHAIAVTVLIGAACWSAFDATYQLYATIIGVMALLLALLAWRLEKRGEQQKGGQP